MNGEPQNPGPNEADREADARLIDALLRHLYEDQVSRPKDLRIQRVMAAIDATEETGFGSSFRLRIFRALYAAAAVIVIAAGLFFISRTTQPAAAFWDDMIKAIAKSGDCTYLIQVTPKGEVYDRRDHSQGPFGRPAGPGLDGATLYIRDGIQYVLLRTWPDGEKIFDGYNGRQSWRINHGEVVEIVDGVGAGKIPMPQVMADIPFTDLPATLEQIKLNYTIQCFELASLKAGGPKLRHVLANKKSRAVKGPNTIEIWADAKTGMPRRIQFEGAKFQGSTLPRRLTLDLVSEKPLSADWFGYATHCDNGTVPMRRDQGKK